MIVRGIDIADPSLGIGNLLYRPGQGALPAGRRQVPRRPRRGRLLRRRRAGEPVPRRRAARPGRRRAQRQRSGGLKIPGKVLIEQGKADTTVFPIFTDQLNTDLEKNGVKVTYKTYDGVDHGGAVGDKAPSKDATKWIEKAF